MPSEELLWKETPATPPLEKVLRAIGAHPDAAAARRTRLFASGGDALARIETMLSDVLLRYPLDDSGVYLGGAQDLVDGGARNVRGHSTQVRLLLLYNN